jgi:hypothetical protein
MLLQPLLQFSKKLDHYGPQIPQRQNRGVTHTCGEHYMYMGVRVYAWVEATVVAEVARMSSRCRHMTHHTVYAHVCWRVRHM